MNRGQIKTHIRTLADELTEAPEGMFLDTDLDTLINVAQLNVEIDLIEYIPYYFRSSKVFTITVNQTEYDVVDDIGISDFLLFENILHNKTGEGANPLLFVEPDDIWQYTNVGQVGADPIIWGYENKDEIFIRPIPSGTVADRLKGIYFKKIPDLNDDSIDDETHIATPHIPPAAHELIAIEVLKLWHIADEEEAEDIVTRYNKMLFSVSYRLSSRPGLTAALRPSTLEHLRNYKLDVNTGKYG